MAISSGLGGRLSVKMVGVSAGISRSPWLNFGQGLGQRILRFGGIIVQLQTDPESLGRAEES